MIDALLGGTLAKDPGARTAKNGSVYALATLRVPAGGDTVIFARVMAFDAHVRDALLALAKGHAVCVSGALEIGTWNTDTGEVRPSLSVIAHALVSPCHVKRRRTEVASTQQHEARSEAKRTNGTRAPQRTSTMTGSTTSDGRAHERT
ncbi:single-stranded DNA-binding protein [Paraburkholderia sp. Cpub6]|uniref:single-stranded DNA-binding protein n=1 Tax=Paraburkholderia sp. Cpub6 TaxID=2723094 RepID=UPI00161A65CA|nr:single-stranded DNA-binding protein [Paraburkholderia sp. Cpub6]MBB5459019.1 single-stranded DNA-binding protein [Paraburkholderia sp. Cpub6]